MKLDVYTKFILTVIAASLLVISLEKTIRPNPALAQGVPKVIIAGIDSTTLIPVRLIGGKSYNLLKVDEDNPLPVAIVTK
jgi:hypothetical protein